MNATNILRVGLVLILNATLCAALSFGGWAIFQMAQADGKIDYCYTTEVPGIITGKSYTVTGHRRWRLDEVIVTLPSAIDAETWRTQKCPNR